MALLSVWEICRVASRFHRNYYTSYLILTEFEETQNLTTEYKEKPCEKSDKNLYLGINRILEGYVIVLLSYVYEIST